MNVLVVDRPLIDGITEHLPDRLAVTVAGREQFPAHLPAADAVITDRWPADWFEHADGVAWVQTVSAGVDHFPVDRLKEHGIAVTNASGVHPVPITEYVYGAVLARERGLFTAQRNEAERDWVELQPREVAGRTMTVVGVGAIGSEIAQRADAFDLAVRGVDPVQDQEHTAVDAWYGPAELVDAVRGADYVVLTCPLNDATAGMVDTDVFQAMGEDALLVNVGRGGVVEQDALVTALETGSIGGAVVDVFREEPLPQDSPLWELDTCLVTPHMAGYTDRYAERLADVFTENLDAFEAGEAMPTQV